MRIEHIYNDASGAYLGTIYRHDGDDGSKTFRTSKGFPKTPRPLYGLDRLAACPTALVLVVEGEKTADAAGKLFPELVAVTSSHGSKAANKADWSPLASRDVVIWMDHDRAGAAYACDVHKLVPGARVVAVPASFPEGWDLADDLPAGIMVETLRALIDGAVDPDALHSSTKEALSEREKLLVKVRALLAKTVAHGCSQPEADAAAAKAKSLIEEHGISEAELSDEEPEPTIDDIGADIDGDALLNDVYAFIGRFVSYPSTQARVAHALWIAHAHMMDIWDSTPRLAFMSPERGSGKTRALEATEFLVPRPVHSVNNSVAYVIRKIADDRGKPTILYDEVDALFGSKDPAKADLLALLNAGHRKGATSGRCVVLGGGRVGLEELPAYCALALAGLRDLPDTLASRSILIEMRKRAPDETIEPFRVRIHKRQAQPIFDDLEVWCGYTSKSIAGKYPDVPAEITDRDADCWEPLLAIADAAGGDWPERARDAAVFLVRRGKDRTQTIGVELLEHIYEAFGDEDRLWTDKLIHKLHDRDEGPWAEKGKELTARGLAQRLKLYGIKSRQVRIGDLNHQGYMAADFHDAWHRYLGVPARGKPYRPYKADNKNNNVGSVGSVGDTPSGETQGQHLQQGLVCQACDGNYGKGCPTCKPEAYGLPPKRKAAG